MERRLAAILAADVVGYAGRTARDEDGTVARVEAIRFGVIEPRVEAHRGRLFNHSGDGVLAEFSSTVEAVRCALSIQAAIRRDAGNAAHADPLELRVGVSVGDVLVKDADLLGDGVNVAARLEQLAEPGGVAISSAVFEQVRGKVDAGFDDFGHQRVKATDAPVHVYRTRSAKPGGGHAMRALFDFEDDPASEIVITGGCLCGAVRYEIDQPAISTGYCHCRICQHFSGSAFSVWTAFPLSAVRFTQAEPRYFHSSPIARRGFCPECGSSLTYQLLKPRPAGYLVIFTPSLDRPQDFSPIAHGGFESRLSWLDINDDLPRTTCSESRVLQAAWSSVGISDPAGWVPDAHPHDPS